jgi:hypothetical protein
MLDIKTIPVMLVSGLQDGDILVQMPDPAILFGKAVLEFGAYDAAQKGVPVAMHVLMRTTLGGQPHKLESWFHCREVPFALDAGTYIVVRPLWTAAQRDKGIAYGRAQTNWFGPIGRPYGVWDLMRDGINLMFPAEIRLRGDEAGDPDCSHYAGEILENGGYPITLDDSDANLTPWDFLTPRVTALCPFVGRIEVA